MAGLLVRSGPLKTQAAAGMIRGMPGTAALFRRIGRFAINGRKRLYIGRIRAFKQRLGPSDDNIGELNDFFRSGRSFYFANQLKTEAQARAVAARRRDAAPEGKPAKLMNTLRRLKRLQGYSTIGGGIRATTSASD